MSLDEAGAIGEASFARIVEVLHARRVRRVLELGSGQSTLRLEQAVDARISSVEHDSHWIERVRASIATARTDLVWRPLEPRRFGGQVLWSYAPLTWQESFDAVIIDGPPYWTLRGREACMYEIYDRLPVGAVVFVDDCYREGERAAIRNWCAVYEGSFDVRTERASHGLAILDKVAHVAPRWDASARQADAEAIERCYAELRSALVTVGDFRASTWPLVQMREAYGIAPSAPDRRAMRAALGRIAEILAPRLDPGFA
jgi:predicted O-methyltransferase YrrM